MRHWLAMLALSLFAAIPVLAADAPKGVDAPKVPVDYVLGPGDAMDVTVTSHPGYDRSVTIQPDGKIFFPGVGEVMATGLTVPQLRTRLLQGLEETLNHPDLTISLRDIRSAVNRVSVLGAVRAPSVLDLHPKWRVTEALAAAGGPAQNADMSRITITRANQRVITVDLAPSTRSGRAENNVELEAGDLIIVPEGSHPIVLVLGEVMRPSQYPLELDAKVMDALSLAGGPTPNADLSSATISRLGVEGLIKVDLGAVLVGGDLSKNAALQPGDTLYVPATSRKFYVVGEVGKSGTFPLRGGERIMDAVVAAGGPNREGDGSKAALIRRSPNGQAIATKVDLTKLLSTGDVQMNQPLDDGDVIYIPPRKQKRPFSDYINFLFPLTWLRTIVP
jgi:polysaccharide export outer membrane protein